VQAWTEAALGRFTNQWRAQFRGDVPMVRDVDVTPGQLQRFHLVAWGDPDSNGLLRRAMAKERTVRWSRSGFVVGDVAVDARTHVPSFILPNPMNGERYLVVNSGPTFTDWEGTNARQTPRLPDWAVWRLGPKDEAGPATVVHAGFFDESWRVSSRPIPRKP
jgi:hypothetical protein